MWERKRGGVIKIRAGSAGSPEFPTSEMQALFDLINDRCRTGVTDRIYRRGQLYYFGLPWRGELWLGDTLRLGPPSKQYEDALRGPRVVLVDALVEAVGPTHATYLFIQCVQELSVFMSAVTDQAVHTLWQSRQSWTWTVAADGTAVCDVRSLGYIESTNPGQMPVRGTYNAMALHPVTRPDFSFSMNSFIGANELSLPDDIAQLWESYRSLPSALSRQFLKAAAKWQEAVTQSLDRPTLSFALMVVACEALKPSDRKFDRHNINDVVGALLGNTIAAWLKSEWFRAQYTRSVHLHLGEFLGSEFQPETTLSRFHDPTFDQARRALADITRAAIIEWLRRRGKFFMPALKAKKTRATQRREHTDQASKARKPHSSRASSAS
jgi:hypothetical protein